MSLAKTLHTEKQKQAFRQQLLDWFQKTKRDLPFRKEPSPYRVWLSEIMAQQTTMAAVVPYFNRFVKRFPDQQAVAIANDEELLTYWQGLGYYSRVRNFKIGCQQIINEFKNDFPRTHAEWLTIKGVGDYTASAIVSICFNQAHAVVDGNVKRVLSRLFAYGKEMDQKESHVFFSTQAKELLDQKSPGAFNEAMMELGATICRPKSPSCLLCPIQKHCMAKDENPEKYPVKKKKTFINATYHTLLSIKDEKILLREPHAKSLIKDMWELPGIYDVLTKRNDLKKISPSLNLEKLDTIGTVKHAITNKKITVHVHSPKNFKMAKEWHWVPIDELSRYPVNTIAKKVLKRFRNF